MAKKTIKNDPMFFVELQRTSRAIEDAIQKAANLSDNGYELGLGIELGKLEELGEKIKSISLLLVNNLRIEG